MNDSLQRPEFPADGDLQLSDEEKQLWIDEKARVAAFRYDAFVLRTKSEMDLVSARNYLKDSKRRFNEAVLLEFEAGNLEKTIPR